MLALWLAWGTALHAGADDSRDSAQGAEGVAATGWVAPDLRPAAEQMRAFTKTFTLNAETLPQFRANAFLSPELLPDVPAEKKVVPGPEGAPELTVWVVNARAGSARPGILFADQGIATLQGLARTLDCVIVSVDYRLAPEWTFAASVADNYAGLRWMHGNATDLGLDPRRIAVMGDSAGGGHAALLAIHARDRGEVPIVLQVLIYPMLDDRTGSSRKVPGHLGNILWTPASNRFGWGAFLGQEPGGETVPEAAVPARVEDLSGLPPAFIGVGDLDLFVEEDIEYARRLIAAGVPTELLVVPGAFHAFDVIAPDTPTAQRFTEAKTQALRRAFGVHAESLPLLNSERIRQRYGTYGVRLLSQAGDERVACLYSSDPQGEVCRTVAVTLFEEVPPGLTGAMSDIRAGASIGSTLTEAGWAVEKRDHVLAERSSGPAFASLLHWPDPTSPPRVAVDAYDLWVQRDGESHRLARIAEAHHPDYLGLADLRALLPGASDQGFPPDDALIQALTKVLEPR